MKLKTNLIICCLAGILINVSGTIGFAADITPPAKNPQNQQWAKKHPHQKEVLKRTKNERKRIQADYKAGKITKAQRDQLLSQVKDVRKEDRADSKANGGYITKDQQKVMNQQENSINKEIKGDVKQDAGSSGTTQTSTNPQ